MHVDLDPHLAGLIRQKLESGRYNDTDEVIREALQALDERERFHRLREKVAAGFAQAERGELIEYTPELREELIQSALRRARTGERPSPDVCP